jgi:preprotein translocase subunit SecY
VIEAIASAFRVPELRARLLFTLAMLAVFRLGIFVPAPGVNRAALGDFFNSSQGSLLNMYDLFSGGALSQFSVFVLGIMPYISASILFQIGAIVVPQIERLRSEGQAGRKKLAQYTRYTAVVIALIQAFFVAFNLEGMKSPSGVDIVIQPGLSFQLMTMITMAAGSGFVMWLGEQITDRGIGNGASLIITAGIVAGVPQGVQQLSAKISSGEMDLLTAALLGVFMVVTVMAIVFIERGQRRVPIQYAKRVVGRQVYGGQSTHLPMKVNLSGVMPPIFASSMMMFPATIGTFYPHPVLAWVAAQFNPGSWVYNVTYVGMIVAFAFFYTAVSFNPVDVADNLRRHGGYIPGIRPGEATARHLDRIVTRLTSGGSVYLAALCVLPTILYSEYGLPFSFGGTGLLIVIGVALDTVAQIEGFMLTSQYDGAVSPTAGKGRRGVSSAL